MSPAGLNKAEATVKTITSTESELTIKLSSYDKWKDKIETKIDSLDEVSRSAGAVSQVWRERAIRI